MLGAETCPKVAKVQAIGALNGKALRYFRLERSERIDGSIETFQAREI